MGRGFEDLTSASWCNMTLWKVLHNSFFFFLRIKVLYSHCLKGKSSRGLLSYRLYVLTVCGTLIGSSDGPLTSVHFYTILPPSGQDGEQQAWSNSAWTDKNTLILYSMQLILF